jgi:hypothetical protein
MFSRKRILGLSILGAALVLAGFALGRVTAQDAANTDEPRKLVEEQRKLANRALALIDRSAKIGAPVSNAATDVYQWSYRRLGTRLFLTFGPDDHRTMDPEVYLAMAQGPPNPDRIAAFEEHRELMRSWEARFRGLARTGIGSQLNFLTFQAHLLQAEIWLARERDHRPEAEKP